MRQIIYHVEARIDVLEIVEHYERKDGPLLSKRFVTELRRYIENIASRPVSYPVYVGGVRRANLDHFPHHVLFRILDEETIKIIAVRHNHRRPSYGLHRR